MYDQIITGSTGFIGRSLISDLIVKENNKNFQISRSNGFNLELTNWTNSLNSINGNTVVHLAQSRKYRDFPEGANDMRKINIDATAELLEWSRKNGVKRFIFASTGNVYSSSSKMLIEDDPTVPNSFYGASKLAAEHLVNQYSNFFDIINLRIFTTYGPGQQGMLIPNIINKVKNRNEIKLGKEIGLFTTPLFIDDCVKIIEKLIFHPLKTTPLTLNLAGSQKVSLFDIIRLIEEHLKIDAKIKITEDEPTYLTASNKKLLDLIGPFKFTDIKEGIKQTLFIK